MCPILIFGQSEKPQTILVPSGSLGEISEVKVKILEKTLESKLDEYFDIVPRHLFEEAQEKAFEELDYEECTEEQCIMMIQEMLQIENAFQLEILSDEGDTQLSLTWTDLDKKRVEEVFCEGCKTKDLRSSIEVLIDKLVKESLDPEEILRRKQEEEKKERIESAYRIALDKNSIDSFENFIDEYKDEKLAETFILASKNKINFIQKQVKEKEKEERIAKIKLAFSIASETDTISAHEDFISDFEDDNLAEQYIKNSKIKITFIENQIKNKKEQEKKKKVKREIQDSYENAINENSIDTYKNFIDAYKKNILASEFVAKIENRLKNLIKKKDYEEFYKNYEILLKENNKDLFVKFLKKFKDFDIEQEKIETINYLIKTYPNKNFEKYLKITSNSRETIGCGFLDFSCPDPIIFPVYDPSFHLYDYKRIKVKGSSYPWINSEININENLNEKNGILVFASGLVSVCNTCGFEGSEKRLYYKVGEKSKNFIKFKPDYLADNFSIMSTYNFSPGNLEFTIKDWKKYPPPKEWYTGNKGYFLIDVFIWLPSQKEKFVKFLKKISEKNKNDQIFSNQIKEFMLLINNRIKLLKK